MFCFISVLSRGGWISTPVMSQTSQRLHWGGVRRQLFSADWFFPVGLFSDRVRCNVDGQAGTWGLALVGLVDLAPWTGLWAAWNAVAEAPASEPTCSKSTTLLWLSSTRYRHKLYTFIQKAALSPSYRATLPRLLPDLFRHTFNPKKKIPPSTWWKNEHGPNHRRVCFIPQYKGGGTGGFLTYHKAFRAGSGHAVRLTPGHFEQETNQVRKWQLLDFNYVVVTFERRITVTLRSQSESGQRSCSKTPWIPVPHKEN